MSKALPPSWSGSRVQWHWPVHQTVYEVVHFAADEHVLPSGLDPFWEPAAAPTAKNNKVQFICTKAHKGKCRDFRKEGKSGHLHQNQLVVGHSGKAHRRWILSALRCMLQIHLRPWKSRISFYPLLGVLVAHANWTAGPCSNLTSVILLGTENCQHSWYGEHRLSRITAREGYSAVEIKHLKGWTGKKDINSHALLTCLSTQLRTENLKAFNLAFFSK